MKPWLRAWTSTARAALAIRAGQPTANRARITHTRIRPARMISPWCITASLRTMPRSKKSSSVAGTCSRARPTPKSSPIWLKRHTTAICSRPCARRLIAWPARMASRLCAMPSRASSCAPAKTRPSWWARAKPARSSRAISWRSSMRRATWSCLKTTLSRSSRARAASRRLSISIKKVAKSTRPSRMLTGMFLQLKRVVSPISC